MTQIAFPIDRLTQPQREIFLHPARTRVVVAGRRFGKTWLAVSELLQESLSGKNKTIGYVAPTADRAKDLGWNAYLDRINPDLIKRKNVKESMIELKNGSRVYFRGADEADRQLRGFGWDFVVLDEFVHIKRGDKVWYEILSPALADKQGRALLIGTPDGFNWGYDLFQAALHHHEGFEDFEAWQFTTADGGNVSQEEIEAKRKQLPASIFEQEFLASFTRLANQVYNNFDQDYNVLPVMDSGGVLHIGMDFNVDPMCAVVACDPNPRTPDGKFDLSLVGCLDVFDEIVIGNSTTEEMCQEIIERYPNRHIRVYPDASGRGRSTKANQGVTDISILQDFGFEVHVHPSNPLVKDRINEVQAMLLNADGKRRLRISPKCQKLIYALMGLTYKEGTSIPDKSLGLDHITDALGYMIHNIRPIDTNRFKRRTMDWL